MADIAVLTRNYWEHLSEKIGNLEPVTFYSNVAWKRIERARNNEGKDVVVYFVAAKTPGSDTSHTDEVTYSGKLREILILPDVGNPQVYELLAHAPDEAAKNAIENGQVKTIYSVSGIEEISPFSQTVLQKVSDGKHVSKDYIRSYCIVKPYKAAETLEN